MTKLNLITRAMMALLVSGCMQAGVEQKRDSGTSDKTVVDPATVDGVLQGFIDDKRLVGASALIYENGSEVYFGAYGKADREQNQPMTRDTLVQVYSMTKPVVGVALMTLHEQGKFDLRDPVAKYVPELGNMKLFIGTDENGEMILAEPERQPIVLDLMRHTVGFADENTPGVVGELWRDLDPTALSNTHAEVAQKLGSIPLVKEPGTAWRYGPSVEIQALIVERLAGKPLAEYLRETLFEPLEMDETFYYVKPALRDRFAQMYVRNDEGELEPAPSNFATDINFEHLARNPGGYGLVSTLDDYMRFARMLLNQGSLDGEQIIKPETLGLMTQDYLGEAITDRAWLMDAKGQVGWGLDFAVRLAPPKSDNELYGFPGEFAWDGLATTFFWVDPSNDLVTVFFTQVIPHQDAVQKDFRDAVYAVERAENP